MKRVMNTTLISFEKKKVLCFVFQTNKRKESALAPRILGQVTCCRSQPRACSVRFVIA